MTFNSKNNPTFTINTNEKIDENSIIKTEGTEKGISHSHYYTDLENLKYVLEKFKIIKIRQIEDIWEDGNSWHYFVHIKKA